MQNVNPHMYVPSLDISTTRQESPTSFPGYSSFLKRQDESPPLFGNRYRKSRRLRSTRSAGDLADTHLDVAPHFYKATLGNVGLHFPSEIINF